MERKIVLEIECGELTCAKEKGEFCRFAGATHLGTVPACMLFPDFKANISHTELETVDGWTQRCDACLEATRG